MQLRGGGSFVGCGEKERKFSRQNFVLRGGSGGAEIGMLAVGFSIIVGAAVAGGICAVSLGSSATKRIFDCRSGSWC